MRLAELEIELAVVKENQKAIDDKKKNSNRLTSICGKYYIVITKDNKQLNFVGKRTFNKWAKENEYIADF